MVLLTGRGMGMIIKPMIAASVLALGTMGVLPMERGVAHRQDGARPAMLPPRVLHCLLGRVVNFDASRDQPVAEYRYDGRHRLTLFLPPVPARTTPPPDATAAPEPVDPRTRIVADPDGIAGAAASRPFHRVVDLWPSRVEMMTPLSDVVANVIVIAQVTPDQADATIFMARANDATTYDVQHLYFGRCRVARS
ncbi:hypothetical protein [Sphingomonas sp. 8AM]|uniref:hypothetical protein n=1 Tax=Sphingomonas sp. 8AM TaxID=2653170 RepID=UPI0012F034AD|nr:hypothetical protein [Sphingomonas sp. 8AM]VXD01494.1 hypothetical protein SPHINGO8AM_80079 [Sphingomonas sp. 8AM]